MKRFRTDLKRSLRGAAVLIIATCAPALARDAVDGLTLPPGFAIEVFATVPGARSLVYAPALEVTFVSSRGDTVWAIAKDGGKAQAVLTNLKVPNGIAWQGGYLYVAEQHRLVRFAAPSLEQLKSARAEVLYDRLPDSRHHGWRYIAFGADGALYMGIGAPCNVCAPKGLEGSVTRFDPAAWDRPKIVASGVRNTVGMDSHPVTGTLHFTDNGADMMGDDRPPEELNALSPGAQGAQGPQGAAHYGFPWYGGGRDRTGHSARTMPKDITFPVQTFQAHTAPLGVDFYSGDQFPSDYKNDALIAQHGSWNRTDRVGYQVLRVHFDEAGNATGHEPFITGWLRPNQSVTGRPVDIEELPDGSILISDDGVGRVYRVTYQAPSQ